MDRNKAGQFMIGHKSFGGQFKNGHLPLRKMNSKNYEIIECKICGKRVEVYKKWNRIYCSPQCRRLNMPNGDRHHNWKGGVSKEHYGQEFNKKRKLEVRKRDGFTCQECNYTEEQLGRKLDIHHLDYNKRNNNLNNLIALCKSCHTQTNFHRKDWTAYFQGKIYEN